MLYNQVILVVLESYYGEICMVAMVKTSIRVLVLDHHTMVREGVRLLLERTAEPSAPFRAGCNGGFEVVGEAGESTEALKLASQTKPDIILLELNLDGELNTEIIPELAKVAPETRIILLTGIDDRSIQRLAVQLGAMGL